MTDEGTVGGGVTRRRLLYAIGAAGSAGAAGGLGTAAYLADEERLPIGSFTGGSLDVAVDCESDGCAVAGDGGVTLALSDLRPGDAGVERFSIDLAGNPAWLWLGASCPESDLADVLEVTVTADRGCDGTPEASVTGTLREVLAALHRGLRLGDACVPPGAVTCVDFAWRFPDRPGVDAYRDASLAFELRFYAVQCRHTDGGVVPFDVPPCEDAPPDRHGISYVEIWGCLAEAPACSCTRLGSLELSDAYVRRCSELQTDGITENHIEPGVYDLPEDDDCVDSGYDVAVTDTRGGTETTAIAFELLDEHGDPGPDLCRVVVKGGTETVTYEGDDLGPRSNDTGGLLAAPNGSDSS